MEIQGKVIARMEPRSGTSAKGTAWTSVDFVIEYDLNTSHPLKIVLNFFGDKADSALQELHMNTEGTFCFDIDAHEYNGKWYNQLRCWKYELGTPQQVAQSAPVQTAPPPQQIPASQPQGYNPNAFANNNASDNLPF